MFSPFPLFHRPVLVPLAFLVSLGPAGQAPRRLHPDEPTPVPDGAILDIGEGIILWVVTAT